MNEELGKLFEGIELSEEAKTALSEKFEAHTNGLVNNKNQIIQENRQYKDQLAALKGQVESFSGKEEELNKFKQLFEQNEEAKLIAEGKYQEVIDSKIKGYKQEIETFKTSKQEEIDGYKSQIEKLQNSIYDYQLNDNISKVALADENFDKSDSSLELLKMLAKGAFTSTEDGFKYKDETKLDKDGNPLNFESWFNTVIKTGYGQLFNGVGGAGASAKGQRGKQGIDNKALGQMSMAEYRKHRKG